MGPKKVKEDKMRRLGLVLLFFVTVLALAGCKHVIRDPEVYQVELTQWDTWATKQAALLKGFMAQHCTCDTAGVFTTPACAEAADFVLTVEARHEWHQQMALYNGRLVDERPPKDPPVIPESKSLCPGGE